MEKLFKEYVNYKFESSCHTTPEFRSFATKFRNRLKKACAVAGLELIDCSRGHFYVSGFVKNPVTKKFAYFYVGDVRWDIMGKPLESCLVRTAQDEKDYTGGANTYCKLPDMVARISKLTA